MATISNSAISCGVKQLHRLFSTFPHPQDSRSILIDAFRQNRFSPYYCMIVFSDTIRKPSRGTRLAKYIKDNKLGTVTASPVRTNPNSRNRIRTWIWCVDRKALKKWIVKNA